MRQGFENTNAQLMTVPPYVAGAISAVVFSTLSDRFYWEEARPDVGAF
jgi:hypothetical protein